MPNPPEPASRGATNGGFVSLKKTEFLTDFYIPKNLWNFHVPSGECFQLSFLHIISLCSWRKQQSVWDARRTAAQQTQPGTLPHPVLYSSAFLHSAVRETQHPRLERLILLCVNESSLNRVKLL